MNKAIRSHLKELRESEAKVRQWWKSVPERKKRDWLSASAVFKNWKKSQRPPLDPDAPRRPSPIQKERETNVALQEALRDANEKLKHADGRDLFDVDNDSAEAIGRTIVDRWKTSPSRIETLIKTLTDALPEVRRRIKAARGRRGLRPLPDADAARVRRIADASGESAEDVKKVLAAVEGEKKKD
jgi:hypothetical protein